MRSLVFWTNSGIQQELPNDLWTNTEIGLPEFFQRRSQAHDSAFCAKDKNSQSTYGGEAQAACFIDSGSFIHQKQISLEIEGQSDGLALSRIERR